MKEFQKGYSLAISHATALVKSWTDTDVLLLKSGDMTAQEIRTVKAVLNAILRSLHSMRGQGRSYGKEEGGNAGS